MADDTPTYNGQTADQGDLAPHDFPGEPYALLVCGNTRVRLSYSAMHLISGWLPVGAHGYDRPGISGPICAAFYAVTCEVTQRRKAPDVVALQDLADQLAGMVTEEEFGDDGMSGDDAVSTLSSMIDWARTLSDRRPDLTTAPTHPDQTDAHREPI